MLGSNAKLVRRPSNEPPPEHLRRQRKHSRTYHSRPHQPTCRIAVSFTQTQRQAVATASYVERNKRIDRFSWSTGTPKLIPIRECLAGQAPTSDSLWDEITHNIKPRQEVEVVVNMDNGTQITKEIRWNKVVSTLLKEIGRSTESTSEFSAIFGLPLAAEDIQLALPARFGRILPEYNPI
jgi:hypothetical protein